MRETCVQKNKCLPPLDVQVHPTTKQHELLAKAFLEYAGKLFQ